jgi:hypothetical protein
MGRQMPCRDPQKAKAEPVPYCLLIQDLAMLVRRLIRKHPNLKLAAQATDFLRRKGLQGNILRTAQDNIGNGELPEAAPLSGEGGERKITPEAAYHNKYGSEAPRGYCCENGNFEDGHKCMKQPGAVAAQGPSPKESIMHRAFDYQQPATPYGELKERLSAQGQKDQTGDGDKLLAEYDRAFDRVSAFGAGRDDRDAWLKPRAEILKRLQRKSATKRPRCMAISIAGPEQIPSRRRSGKYLSQRLRPFPAPCQRNRTGWYGKLSIVSVAG